MSKSSNDRNLLFGILALQMDFITREQLIAGMNAWVLTKDKPLGDLLGEQQALSTERRGLLDALVAEHLKQHGGDPQQSLAAISSVDDIKDDLARINDPDLTVSVMQIPTAVAPDPHMTMAPSVGASTSSGTRFRIVRSYARGGLGEVFVAQDQELHREVAVKQIQLRHADETESRIRFVQEAEITGGLEHPGIVPVYGLGSYADGRPFYAMRFIRGDSLKDAIEEYHSAAAKKHDAADRNLELRALLRRFIDVCEAIDYAHSRGVLHRDLKPGNIMLGKYGETLVVDWGLAKALDRPDLVTNVGEAKLRPSTASGSAATLMGSAVGTPQFMSPEQAGGRLDLLGPTSDVYSLGATLYCLLTGKVPFQDSDLGLVLRKVERAEFPRPSEICKEIPPALEAICLKAMAQYQTDRYQTPRALADDIEHWLADEPVPAYREPAGERLARWSRRNRAWAQSIAAALFAVAVIAVVAAVLIARSWQEEAAARATEAAARQAADAARQTEAAARQAADVARQKEAEARQEAERGFREARDAVNDYFTVVSENKLLDVPGLQPLRKELLESALHYYQQFLTEHADDPSLHADVALTWYRVGRIEAEINRNADAVAALNKARVIQEATHMKSPSTEETAELADTDNALGDLAQRTAELDDAKRWFQQAANLRQSLVASNPHDAKLERKLANSHENLAVVDAKLARLDAAKEEFAAADKERQQLVADHPDSTQYRRDLAQGRYNMATMFRDANQLAAARDWVQQATTDYEELGKRELKSIEIHREWALSNRVAGDIELLAGNLPAASTAYESALHVAEPLARANPLLLPLQDDVANIYVKIGNLQLRESKSDEALKQLERARGILEQLTGDDPGVSRYRVDLVSCLRTIGEIQRTTSRLADAEATWNSARAAQEQLVADSPENSTYQLTLGKLMDDLAVVRWMLDKKSEAVATSEQATVHLRRAFDTSPESPGTRAALNKGYMNLAGFKRQSGKPAEAAAVAQEQRKLWSGNADELFKVARELALIAESSASGSEQPPAVQAQRRAIAQQAIEVLQEAVAGGFNKLDQLKSDPQFKILAGEPAFTRLLERRSSQ
jgi:eukaryotic-like serine/threonine-protein kinase